MSVYDDVAREAQQDYRDWLRDEYVPEVTAADFAGEDHSRREPLDPNSPWAAPTTEVDDSPPPF